MTRLDALKELAAKVEAGECRQEEIARAAFDVQPTLTPWRGVCGEAYNGSIDAAKALHEAVLPGWGWCIDDWNAAYVNYPCGAMADYLQARSDNPARAWLLAILRALIAQEKSA